MRKNLFLSWALWLRLLLICVHLAIGSDGNLIWYLIAVTFGCWKTKEKRKWLNFEWGVCNVVELLLSLGVKLKQYKYRTSNFMEREWRIPVMISICKITITVLAWKFCSFHFKVWAFHTYLLIRYSIFLGFACHE